MIRFLSTQLSLLLHQNNTHKILKSALSKHWGDFQRISPQLLTKRLKKHPRKIWGVINIFDKRLSLWKPKLTFWYLEKPRNTGFMQYYVAYLLVTLQVLILHMTCLHYTFSRKDKTNEDTFRLLQPIQEWHWCCLCR